MKKFTRFERQIFLGNGFCGCSGSQIGRLYHLLQEALGVIGGNQQSPDDEQEDVECYADEIYLALTGRRPEKPKKKKVEPFYSLFAWNDRTYGWREGDPPMKFVWNGSGWNGVDDDPLAVDRDGGFYDTEREALMELCAMSSDSREGMEVRVWYYDGSEWNLVE